MSAITETSLRQSGAFAIAETTLGAADTLTYDSTKKQILFLRNPTGGTINVLVKGSGITGGSTSNAAGIGAVDVSAGKTVAVAAGARVGLDLNSVSAFLTGATVNVTGGTGAFASLLAI